MEFAAEIAGLSSPTKKAEKFDMTNSEVLKAQMIIHGLGGKDNIWEIENCMSRLRIVLKAGSLIDENVLNKTGCNGIVKPSDTDIQIVYGTAVNLIKKNVEKEMLKS